MITKIKSPSNLYLKYSKETYGWGVFTDSPIKKGDIVETCYCLLENLLTTSHGNYAFSVNNKTLDVFHALGYGGIYNHNDNPNMVWKIIDIETRVMEFIAIRDIEKDTELTHNYGKVYWSNKEGKNLI